MPYSLIKQNFQVLTTPWDPANYPPPEFTFTIDGSVFDGFPFEPCDDPLSIRFLQPIIPYQIPGGSTLTGVYEIFVADYQNDIESVTVTIEDVYYVDGVLEDDIRDRLADVEVVFVGSPLVMPIFHAFTFECLEREALVKLRIEAVSALPEVPDPETDPNNLVKYEILRIGDFNDLVHQWFHPEPAVFDAAYVDIMREWTDPSYDYYRNITPTNAECLLTLEATCYDNPEPKEDFDDATYYLLKHPINDEGPGGDEGYDHYGAVRVPAGDPPSAAGWPILVLTHYGREIHPVHPGHDIYPNSPVTEENYQDHMCNNFIQVFPSYRGNTLHWVWPIGEVYSGPESIVSTGDWEVDDTLVFLHLLINDTSEVGATGFSGIADTSKIAMMGGSRGGIPTYIGKLRDSLAGNNYIDAAIVEFGSGTDIFLTNDLSAPEVTPIEQSLLNYIENINYVEYIDANIDYRNYPGYIWEPLPLDLDLQNHYFNEDYLVYFLLFGAYMSDYNNISIEDGVKRMLRSSPKWFVNEPMADYGKLQVHHGIFDPLARYQHAKILASSLGIDSYADVERYDPLIDPDYPPYQFLTYGEMPNNHVPVEVIYDGDEIIEIIPMVPKNHDKTPPPPFGEEPHFWDYMSDLLNWVIDEAD